MIAATRGAAAALSAAAWVIGSGLAGAGDIRHDAAPAAIFLSGHSLTDRPIPDDLAALLAASGGPIVWDRQHISGSSIRERSAGSGTDREGRPIDASRDVFAGRKTPYDTLIVTEQHVLPAVLLWNDTVGELRRLHDRFAAHNPEGVTYLYEPWMAIDDKDDPRRWIAYERAAAPVWRCVAAATGSKGIVPLPAATALAELIAAAIDGPGIPGLTRATARETVDLLVADDVHPTRLGSYYIALVVYAAITGRSPMGAWAPDGVPPDQARALQDFLARAPSPVARVPDLETCAASLRAGALEDLWAYVERAHWRKERGFLAARWARLRQSASWQLRLWREPDWTPFRSAR